MRGLPYILNYIRSNEGKERAKCKLMFLVNNKIIYSEDELDETISSLHNMSMNVESEEESRLIGVDNTRNKKRSRETTSKNIVSEKGKKKIKVQIKKIYDIIFI